jgi:hypothetical protein
MICLVDYDSSSKLLIRPYSPDSDYDLEEEAYQELVDRMDKGRRK